MTDPRIRTIVACAVLLASLFIFPAWMLFMLPWPVLLFMPVFTADCTIFSDDFSTDQLATEYDVRSGTWAVGSGVLTTSSSAGVLRCETAVTTGLTAVYATVAISASNSNGNGRLLIAYSDDSNYWIIRVRPRTNHGSLQLFQRSGGVETIKANCKIPGFQANESLTVALCYQDSVVRAYVASVSVGCQASATITIEGTKCGVGVGSGGATTLTFDNFEISKHQDDDSGCPECTEVCPIFSDDFSTDDLADFYSQVAGSWSVASGQLTTSSSNALVVVIDVGATSASATAYYASVYVTCETTSDVARFVFLYLDASNYWFAEIECGATDGTLKLYERSGGINTLRGNRTIPSFVANDTIAVCAEADSSSVRIVITGKKALTVEATPTLTRRTAGCATASVSSSVQFDDLTLSRHADEHDGCPECIATACDAAVLGIVIYNHNSLIDDDFDVTINGTSIGTIDNNSNSCTGRIFAASTALTGSNVAAVTCGTPNFQSTLALDMGLVVAGTNTLRVTSTVDNGNSNLGTALVGLFRLLDGEWVLCETLVDDVYDHAGFGGGGEASYSEFTFSF